MFKNPFQLSLISKSDEMRRPWDKYFKIVRFRERSYWNWAFQVRGSILPLRKTNERKAQMANYNTVKYSGIDYIPLSQITCPKCSRTIIPKVIYYYGGVIITCCPFCISTIWRPEPSKKSIWICRLFVWGCVSFLALPFLFGLLGFH